MDNNDFEKWYNKADENMPIPLLENTDIFHEHRDRQWIRLRRRIWKRYSPQSLWLFAAASTVIIGLFLTTAYRLLFNSTSEHFITYTTTAGQTKTILLPDSSLLYLYEATTVRLNPELWKTERTIKLQEGQLFIDVKPDTEHPFRIDTDSLHIRVLGTSFWVRNYASENEREIAVKSGKVEVRNNKGQQNTLTRGEKLIYDTQTGEIRLQRNNLTPVNDDFILIYQNEKLSRILADLERRYNKTLTISGNQLSGERYTISFDKKLSLEECLDKLYIIGSGTIIAEDRKIQQ